MWWEHLERSQHVAILQAALFIAAQVSLKL